MSNTNVSVINDIFSNLVEFLGVSVQGQPMSLLVSVPRDADIQQELDDETYQLWRDKYVHEFWCNPSWINRDKVCPVEVLKKAHVQSIKK